MGVAGISGSRCAVLALLVLALSLSVIALTDISDDSSADDFWVVDNIKYTAVGGSNNLRVDGPLSDTYIRESIVDVVIPSTMTLNHEKYTVTEIASNAFVGCTNLRSITTESTVVIGDYAFYGCGSLGSIKTSQYTETIGQYAFSRTGIVSAEINGPIYSLNPHIFEGCSKLKTVIMSDTIVSIDESAFAGCTALTDLVLPADITILNDSAFAQCSSLKSIVLPNTITYFGARVFSGCSSLIEITMPDGMDYISEYAFENCTALRKVAYSKNMSDIYPGAFYGCSQLSSIPLDERIRSIGSEAFHGCSSIRTVRITSDLRSIGDCAFSECSGLKHITFPMTVRSIGKDIFNGITFYDRDGKEITDQSKLPGYSYDMVSSDMVRSDGCYYTIDYDVSEGSVYILSREVDFGYSFVITEYEGAKEGMVFSGWECEGTLYKVGDTFTMPGHSVAFTSVWEKYVPPPDTRLIDEEAQKFIIWAAASVLFGLTIFGVSLLIIYKRRH